MKPSLTLLLAAALFVVFPAALNAQNAPGIERIRDVIYAKHDGVALTMDVFKPTQPNGAGIIKIIREGGGHGGWQEMGEDNERMVGWFDLHLLGKQPAKAFTYTVSFAPSTPVKKAATNVPAPVTLNQLSEQEKAEGWRLLFDGKSTAGWRGYRSKEMPPKWEILDRA